ncbi:MAG: hypothetical protein KAV87_14495 [Desulfobacteraceae bacterium]|jgi:chromosome segregation and condensation protein ScpB|nr:hypothetical protein [Desulfobacteraceae bacterium]
MIQDEISKKCLKVLNSSDMPLHTMEIARKLDCGTQYKVQNRLMRLMNSEEISGRLLDVAKGIWVWWRKDAFGKVST